MVKKEARILGIDDAPFDKFKDKEVLVIGTFFRGGSSLDGVLSTTASVDGSDATAQLIKMVKKSKFYTQLQAIMLKGIAVAGFNIIDINELYSRTKVPVIVVMRDLPNLEEMRAALIKLGSSNKKFNAAKKLRMLEKAGQIISTDKLYAQLAGLTAQKAKELLAISCTRSNIPEPIRVAHLIAAGIMLGESRGKA